MILQKDIHYIIIKYNKRQIKKEMKQMSLFDSFNKKGSTIKTTKKTESNVEPNQIPSKQSQKLKTNHKDHEVIDQKQKIIESFDKIMKKNNKLTLDSDDQNEYKPQNKQIQLQEYQNKCEKKIPLQKSKTKKQTKDQSQDMEMDVQQSEQVVNKSTKKKKPSQQKINLQAEKPNLQDPLSQFTDATPQWAQKQHCRDSQKRNPNDPQYDPTTLYIPEAEWSKFTAPMKQFWKIKSQNFDKIILFKLGKFYQLFYDDAAIGNKYLDLKFMGTKMHTGFPQKSLDRYADELVRLGFKTVVVQQMQTPDQMNERIKKDKQKGKKSDKTLKRQVTQIFTKGTMPINEENQENYLPHYLLSMRLHLGQFAFSLLDIATNQVAMGLVNGIQNFKTVLYQTRPVQVVYDPDNLPNDIIQMMQKSFLQMQMSKVINKHNLWHPLTAQNQLERLQKQGHIKTPKIFTTINGMSDVGKNLLYSTLSGMFDYLKKVFRFDYVIGTARFVFYQKDQHTKAMILDSQALQHLQVFQTAEGQQGSLFQVIDRTKTKFGRRLLRRWIMSPLINPNNLNERLNAIEDLQDNTLERNKVSNILKKLPDLQKKANKLYHYAVKNTTASKAIYFEDIHVNKLKQFRDFMQKMQNAWQAVVTIQKISTNFRSNRLKKLVKLDPNEPKIKQIDQNAYYREQQEDEQDKYGILPNIIDHLQQFKSYVKWEGNVPVPQKGLISYYDQLQEQIQKIKVQFQKYIEGLRYEINQPNLKFVHTKQRYQIEIPQKSEKRRPKDFQFSSKKSGFSRYLSPTTKKLVKQLQKSQQNLKQQLGLFVGFFFQQFKKKHIIWQKFIEIIGQIDCLISLSEYSFLNNKVRPQYCQNKFEIRNARHPCLTGIQLIPNDIIMQKKIMLLTGPNMGGKSTILRTACTLVVLAQIGCYVPAQSYKCQPIDRIFTRIGASDKLELGKSTFFIEMQQTKNILMHGTSRSLTIIDELGRGTSTFDGLSIAYSVLKDITRRLKSYCLFATHYHILLEQFKQDPSISLMKMATLIKNNNQMQQQSNSTENDIIFLYKLVPGNVDKSFGLNVAKKVGISNQTIKVAQQQAKKMNKYIESKQRSVYQAVLEFINNADIEVQMDQEH